MRRILRNLRRAAFFVRHGFDRDDLYSLDTALARWVLPRLIRFNKIRCGHPAYLTEDEWSAKLRKMIRAFELISSPKYYCGLSAKEDSEITSGLASFAAHYRHLWY